ncbi:uncharacterized protein Z519_02034 [Cladophialophora bantiana CBS 173.52]|uniref:feruloyl esterase n=1 Tax=Cladophialophora bantiana (strain ATCC 10958 / CBS 173.52 / CDC B-1940 / NIH 8579) TaxID=1442370 RepID=A0A0D2HT38_CLAB1|nr:uncharacterized protein Z519_02034 [Cladophialophora bantiana CBS 173.52]KIW96643.1 hypothetical protein Z519_02034 [Cladophialophora bantiana CBS 173.52]
MLPSFHGNGKDTDYQVTLSKFTESALLARGTIYTNAVSDKVFISDLLNYMRDNYCVNNSRIYASGKSIGGGLVDELACSPGHGGDFAALAMDAAAIYTETDGCGCRPARSPIPILELHGTNDNTVNYNGDTSHGAPLPASARTQNVGDSQ